ncbi:MAG TPA: hypothetical protein VJ746_08720 [Nitrospira sp.]|nr:hypothetical protein [Nitrospira sp.]
MTAAEQPYFRPHLPDVGSFDGTLIVADSHHRGKEGGRSGWGAGFDALLDDDERNWTIAQIKDCTSLGRTKELYHVLKDILYPHLTVTECFARVAFVNACPEVLPEIGASLPLAGIPASFRANLAAVDPDRILVVSKRVWKALPRPDETHHLPNAGEIRQYGRAWATWCYHPTGRFSRLLFRKDRDQLGLRLAAVTQRSNNGSQA